MAQEYLVRVTALDASGRLLGVAAPVSSYGGEDLFGLFEYPQDQIPLLLPPDIAERVVSLAFAVAPQATVVFELLSLKVQTQVKLPDNPPPTPVFRDAYPADLWQVPQPIPTLGGNGP
jgi:hypothetical protein